MKTFILALTILLLTTVFILWDAWYINHTSQKLLDLLEILPREKASVAEFSSIWLPIHKYWQKAEPYFKFLLGHDSADKITDLMQTAAIQYINDEFGAYRADVTLLQNALLSIQEGEQIHVANLF